VRRCGKKNYLFGRDVIAWLDGGELLPPVRAHERNGTPAA
jgi:hypothetical protein